MVDAGDREGWWSDCWHRGRRRATMATGYAGRAGVLLALEVALVEVLNLGELDVRLQETKRCTDVELVMACAPWSKIEQAKPKTHVAKARS